MYRNHYHFSSTFLILVAVLWSIHLFSQEAENNKLSYRLITPSGNYINELSEMFVIPDTSKIFQDVSHAINTSYMGDAIQLYNLAQNYLINQGYSTGREPAYIAVTKNQGGYARKGFVLNDGNTKLMKPNGMYVDIHERAFQSDINKLMSITQLYPHELAHILLMMLSSQDSIEFQSYNVNMHYFSLLTDYRTAFNEGFAEHVENISRLYEKNDSIRNGTIKDIENCRIRCPKKTSGFKKDLNWSFRLGYYKASMLLWYQKFEDFKRYEHAMNGIVANKNFSPHLSNPADIITFRNAGIEQIENVERNTVQLMSCEGFISSFFTKIIQSNLPDRYVDRDFYLHFLEDTTQRVLFPEKEFSRVQNQMMKYFYILHKYVLLERTKRAQLIDFIDGYCYEFPDEAETLLGIYKDLSGQKYQNQLPPQLLMMVKNYPHRKMVFDAVGAATIPVYTFDLNAAEPEDLMTIKGIGRAEATKITDYRNRNGFFQTIDELQNIPGLKPKTISRLCDSKFDANYFNNLEDPGLNVTRLILLPLWYLFKKGMFWFVVLMVILYFVFIRKSKNTPKQNILILIKYFSIWLIMIYGGLALVIFNNPALPVFLILFAIMGLAGILTVYKSKEKSIRFGTIFSLMGIIVMFSLL